MSDKELTHQWYYNSTRTPVAGDTIFYQDPNTQMSVVLDKVKALLDDENIIECVSGIQLDKAFLLQDEHPTGMAPYPWVNDLVISLPELINHNRALIHEVTSVKSKNTGYECGLIFHPPASVTLHGTSSAEKLIVFSSANRGMGSGLDTDSVTDINID